MLKLIILLFILLGIWVLWLYADPRPLKQRFKDKILVSYALIYAVVLPQILSYLYFQLPHGIWDNLLLLLGIMLTISGAGIDIWARVTMNKFWGPPGQHDTKRQTKLITYGPFAYSRNPIYIGTFLLTLGFSLILRSVFFLLPLILLFYFHKKILTEEKLLEEIFRQDYLRYKQRVPRYIG